MQKLITGWDIGHRFSIMCEADIALGVDNTVQGHASQLEEIDFLPVRSRNRMVGIGQPAKWNRFILPVLPENWQ